MKLTNTRNASRKAGMTLLELTVVILVLLSLITVLFIGARQWKKGSDRAGCIMNIRNAQQAVRGYANMYGKNPSDAVTGLEDLVIGTGKFIEKTPVCPGGGVYGGKAATIPAVGVLWMTCSFSAEADGGHVPLDIDGW